MFFPAKRTPNDNPRLFYPRKRASRQMAVESRRGRDGASRYGRQSAIFVDTFDCAKFARSDPPDLGRAANKGQLIPRSQVHRPRHLGNSIRVYTDHSASQPAQRNPTSVAVPGIGSRLRLNWASFSSIGVTTG